MSSGNKSSLVNLVKKTGLAQSVVKATTLAINKLAPDWTSKKVEGLLLTPKSKKHDKRNIPHGINLLQIHTPEGPVQAYQLGHGPTVILAHGWADGACTFFPLMNGLSQCGFKALAFDHLGHGHSTSNKASLLHFISTTNAVLQHVQRNSIEGLAAVVAHSMSCVAVANAQAKLIKDVPLMFIAPVYDFKKYFTRQMTILGLHPTLCRQYLSSFESNYNIDFDKIGIKHKLVPYASDTVIVHDKNDDESHYLDSVKFSAENPLTKLLLTKDLGHQRIINSESVWQQLKSHLNYEDITANRF